jgi:hypothetical protein
MTTTTQFHELLHPLETLIGVRARRGNKLDALVVQRFNVLVPELESSLGRQVGLGRYIGPGNVSAVIERVNG